MCKTLQNFVKICKIIEGYVYSGNLQNTAEIILYYIMHFETQLYKVYCYGCVLGSTRVLFIMTANNNS